MSLGRAAISGGLNIMTNYRAKSLKHTISCDADTTIFYIILL